MTPASSRHSVAALVIRWIARAWSLLSVGFVALIFIGEAIHPSTTASFTLRDLIGLFFFPFGTCLGMFIGWRWEAVGGGITVGSLLAFYAALRLMDGKFPGGPYFALVAMPGFLFLLAWLISRVRARESQA